ncbi:MAG: DMT family transporter [Deltaproteobacteria bacterium]|jgi:drug/metabolite transporter (DMT)-like permease
MPLRHLRRGPLLMALAALAFTVMAGAVKVARSEMSPFEVITFRCIVSLPFCALYCAVGSGTFVVHGKRMILLRSLLGFFAMVGLVTATKSLPLADLTLITKLQPLIVALGAPLLMGATERVGPVVWGGLVLGLAGCAVLIGPQLAAGTPFGLIALGATCLSAGAHLAVRRMGKSESPQAIVFWFQLTLLPLAILGQLAFDGTLPRIPPAHLVGPVVLVGIASTFGQVLMTNAYRHDRAAVVAAASYSSPVWAVIADVLVFDLLPTARVWIGGALVILAGLLVVYRRNAAN